MISKFAVFIHLPQQRDAVPTGILNVTENNTEILQSTFHYGLRYIERHNRLALDPLTLTIAGQSQVAAAMREPPISGNGRLTEFGVFRDASPDLWGRRVIENKLARSGSLPESVYLKHAGNNRTGALDFRESPKSLTNSVVQAGYIDLEYLLEASERVQAGERLPGRLALLFEAGPSMGGARPKAVIVAEGREWLAKFKARDDRFNIPHVEYATLEMARAAGLHVPPLRLESVNGHSVMLIERFDRQPLSDGMGRRHFLSALTMLAMHESESALASYEDIALAITRYGPHQTIRADLAELFGRMVFNILVNNNDDHLRNHGFLWMPEQNGWCLSPLYDVVPMPVASRTRYLHLSVGEQGRLANLLNAMSRYGVFGLSRLEAEQIIERIALVTREWRTWFDRSGVSEQDMDYIAAAFQHPRELGWAE